MQVQVKFIFVVNPIKTKKTIVRDIHHHRLLARQNFRSIKKIYNKEK